MPEGIHDLPENLPFGVYTSFRTFEHNKFLGLDDHLQRLRQSAALLGLKYDLDTARLRQMLHEVCSAYPLPDARVRIDVLSEPAPALPDACRELITLAPFTPIPARHYEKGIHLGVAPDLHRSLPMAKTADFILARNSRPGDPRFFDYLLLDDDGNAILEASTSNFYAISGGTLWTAADGILEGITRKIILHLAPQLNIPLRLEPIPLEALPRCDEAFISSSSRGLVPVVAIEDETIGSGQPGPVTRRLMEAYEAYVAQALKPAIE
jgi:branched-subunit amino acid aminotransferase/4-amino-4-deoxychorismate lyase